MIFSWEERERAAFMFGWEETEPQTDKQTDIATLRCYKTGMNEHGFKQFNIVLVIKLNSMFGIVYNDLNVSKVFKIIQFL